MIMYISNPPTPKQEFQFGYLAFFKGEPLDANMSIHWQAGWNMAFADVMREHEANKELGR